MNKYIINYKTDTGRVGYAIIYACNPNQAQIILTNQGVYKNEKYLIESTIEDNTVCQINTIVAEQASSIPFRPTIIPAQKEDNPFIRRLMKSKYLYEIEFKDQADYDYADQYFKSQPVQLGGCSSFKQGRFYARNYDWYYNNTLEFVIRTKRSAGRCATLGVAANPKITTGTSDIYDNYRILPFLTLDGINEYGVCVSSNVTPANENGFIPTTGTIPSVETRKEICMIALPRYILDYFSSADEAIDYIQKYVSIYTYQGLSKYHYELHIMIADKNHSYLMEFVNNEIKIVKDNISTNFRRYNTAKNVDGTINISTVSTYASGIERYNKIVNGIPTLLDTEESILNFMSQELKYTNSYSPLEDPIWYTEFVGDYGDYQVTAQNAPTNEHMPHILEVVRERFANRKRGDGLTWHTVHTSVYDMNSKSLALISQEDNSKVYRFTL